MRDPADKIDQLKKAWLVFVHSGELDSLKEVYIHYFDFLFNYGKNFCTDQEIIEDAIQNIFVRLLKNREKLIQINNFNAYLITSFRNEVMHLMRQKKKNEINADFESFQYLIDNSVHDKMEGSESAQNLKAIIKRMIKQLSSSQQEIIFLRFYAGLAYDEISEILNISVESCRTSIYRAVGKLKSEIKDSKKNTLFYISFFSGVLKWISHL